VSKHLLYVCVRVCVCECVCVCVCLCVQCGVWSVGLIDIFTINSEGLIGSCTIEGVGVWSVGCGVWGVECGVWSVGC
jgi:hypothetical protein